VDTDPQPSNPPPARFRPRPPALVVADAMLTTPKVFGRDVTVAEARHAFSDDHVHALLVVQDGVLLSVLERTDLRAGISDDKPASRLGSLAGRTVDPHADLEQVRSWMVVGQCRRLAVVDINLHLLGLLCMKRSYRGFCSNADIRARASDPVPRPRWTRSPVATER
jgi:predicted transcriptional regulator